MKLDRNTNRGERGKYALVNMRKLIPTIEAIEKIAAGETRLNYPRADDVDDMQAFERLVNRGIITIGNETPGDQFFVLKYKDKFTWPALEAYSHAVTKAASMEARLNGGATQLSDSLGEYGAQMMDESEKAKELGNRIPD